MGQEYCAEPRIHGDVPRCYTRVIYKWVSEREMESDTLWVYV